MKNMKKLLAVMAALGLSTVATFNVVACDNSTASNDLTKSFLSNILTLLEKELKKIGFIWYMSKLK